MAKDHSKPQNPKSGQEWYNLGNVLRENGQLDEAIEAYRQALSDPKFAVPGYAWNNLGAVLNGRGDVREAINAYRKALTDPGYDTPGIAWNNLGIALRAEGKLDEAISAYRNALADPRYDTPGYAWNNLGSALRAKGEHAEAVKAYREALADPRYDTPGKAWYNLGNAFSANEEYNEAIEAYRSALADPKFRFAGRASYNLGNALSSVGKFDEAIKVYRSALTDPNIEVRGMVWTNLGNALHNKGELNEAIKAYYEALADPKYDTPVKVWANLAETYVAAQEPKLAKEALQKALQCPDPQGNAHAFARLRLQRLESNINDEALSPDDRAIIKKTSIEVAAKDIGVGAAVSEAGVDDADDIESGIIAAIKAAGDTQYERYVAEVDSGRGDTLSILRGWSSAVTLLEGSERRWRGGGYFLKWHGCGIVIDPGFDFLRNFHDAEYHGREIHAVVVSHNHPDHNSDLKGIDDLCYELFKRTGAAKNPSGLPYVLLWDKDTDTATIFGIAKPQHRREAITFSHAYPQPIDLMKHADIPIRVVPFAVKHGDDVPNAMGMVLELLDQEGKTAMRIGYSGDTEYFEDLHQHLAGCDVLIAHISQPSIEELQDASKLKSVHLGYRGTARLLKECKPKLALIGEFWAGFTDLRIALVRGLRKQSGLDVVLPAGLAMHLKLPSLEIQCTECKGSVPFSTIKVAPPTDIYGNLAYLCPKCLLH